MSNTRKLREPKMDVAALLAEDTRPETVVPICLRGHLQAEWDELQQQLNAMPGDDDRALMSERAAKRRVAERMEELRREMAAGTIPFRLRALRRRRTADTPRGEAVWHELIEKHPPRKDKDGKPDPRDLALGFNTATFFDALVRVSIVDPQLTDEQWEALNAKLTDGQFETLAAAAFKLNRGGVDVPFSRAVSKILTSAAESRQRDSSASASNA